MRKVRLLDRLMARAARLHARRCLHQLFRAADRAAAVQDARLLEKVRRNADSDFGRDHGFDEIRCYDDFARHVPILRYEDHAPYVERVKRGEPQALFGPRERVLMFALTSGTTSEPKYIPVTQTFLNETRRGWNAFGMKALLDHPDAFLRVILQVTSRMDEHRTEAGIPCGAITGLMARTQKRIVRRYYCTPLVVAEIDDARAKYYTIMRLALPEDVAFMITANPATQLKLARTAEAHAEQLIRDIHDGTLWDALPIDEPIRAALAPRLGPRPETARRLERIAADRGRLLPKDYWHLSFLANWLGGTMGLYLREFPAYFGETPVRDIGLIASEGRISVPTEDATPAGLLEITSHFYEFVPREEHDAARPTALRAHEVELGKEYFILLTTSSGLYRYDIGDLVRVVGFRGEAPVIEFLSRGSHISSLAGEKLTEHQVIEAMHRAARCCGAPIDMFVLAARWGDPPYYVLHVEPVGRSADFAAQLASDLDRALIDGNIEYASKRRTGRLGEVRANVLPPGFLAALDTRLRERYRSTNEQYKHQYLYAQPGADDGFPMDPEAAGLRNTENPSLRSG
jgi:hypothetical protein